MESLSIKFYPNKHKTKGDKHKIYLRITINRKKAELATKFFINPSNWNEEKQKAKNDQMINAHLSEIENKIYKAYAQLENDDRAITAQIIRDIISNKSQYNSFLLEYFLNFVIQKENDIELSKETGALYRQTYNKLIEFVNCKFKIEDVHIKQLDYSFIKELDYYLIQSGLVRNTVNKHHSRLRTIALQAVKEGHLKANPYQDFQLRKADVERVALSKEEIAKLVNLDLEEFTALEKIRDKFLFSIYTGLRYKDAEELRMTDIYYPKNERPYLKIKQLKTKGEVKVPLLTPASELIIKYDQEERKVTGLVFPKISNQKLNASLKTITDLAGINKKITHHVARRTFATTILLQSGAGIKGASNLLGHTDIKQTQIYVVDNDDYLNKIIDDAEKSL
jgi:integrase/recombinase XerD